MLVKPLKILKHIMKSAFTFVTRAGCIAAGVGIASGVARIWCQEGQMQKLLGFYRRQLSTVAVRLCTGQSAVVH